MSPASPPPARDEADAAAGEGDDVDACGSDETLNPAEAVDDVELPPAAGGVEEGDGPPSPPARPGE